MKRPTLGVKRQRSRSHEAEDRFGGFAEASLIGYLVRVAFLIYRLLVT